MSKYKVVVTVPKDEADQLRQVIGETGGGQVGNYSFCSFAVTGTGRFLPNDSASPAVGESGILAEVIEERIEVNCDEQILKPLVTAIKEAHSYEEPVIDIYKLEDLDQL